MLSWAVDDLIIDGKSQGDIRQGVTLEVFGEGVSMGPLNNEMQKANEFFSKFKQEQEIAKHRMQTPLLADNLRSLPLVYYQSERAQPNPGPDNLQFCSARKQAPRQSNLVTKHTA